MLKITLTNEIQSQSKQMSEGMLSHLMAHFATTLHCIITENPNKANSFLEVKLNC